MLFLFILPFSLKNKGALFKTRSNACDNLSDKAYQNILNELP